MKIVFHIPRMNWYRVLSPIIEESIRRGYVVECWHQAGAKVLGENCPNREKVPIFRSGVPVIIDYEKQEDIVQLIAKRKPDAVIDIFPPLFPNELRDKSVCPKKPFWLLVDLPPSDSMLQIKNDEELYGCDAFAICNEFYLDASIRYGKQNKQLLLSYVRSRAKVLGFDAARWVESRFMYQLMDSQIQYIRKNSIIVGNASFDEYENIDREKIRRNLGLTVEQKIIVLLPFPFGYDISAPWEQLFLRGSLLSRLYWVVKTKRFDCINLCFTTPSNRKILASLRNFAEKNNSLLIAKIRHSRTPAKEIMDNCHMVLGDNGYYPHTAVELFSIATLVVGHYSFGSIEAVALGTPYLNVDIPGFPKKFYCDTRTPIHNCEPWPKVIWTMSASEAIENLPRKSIDEFQLDTLSRIDYLQKFANWPIGGASSRVLDHLERRIRTYL